MTNIEAHKIIGHLKCGDRLDSVKKLDAMMKAMEALERMIPRKPVEEESDKLCPFCGNALFVIDNWQNRLRFDHCVYCGQAIDWSDDDDHT